MTHCIRTAPLVDLGGDRKPLYLPRRSRHVAAAVWRDYPKPIPQGWHRIARAKGFRIDRRIRDKNHLALECRRCGAQTAQKLFTLRSARPDCAACHQARATATAKAAGLSFLGFDPSDRHYGHYRAACGHVIRRQFELVSRMARGETGARCETCHLSREQAEAGIWDWQRLGQDPKGNANYRLYRHACGHVQRIARTNMQWGQCDCAGCGQSWSAKPSFLYLMDIRHGRDHVLKLGYSANPVKRYRHQLGLPKAAQVELLRVVAMPTGNIAVAQEKRAHAEIRRRFPGAVLPQADYGDFLNVVSEIYRPSILEDLLRLLDQIETSLPDRA